jgi:hypothetical protein
VEIWVFVHIVLCGVATFDDRDPDLRHLVIFDRIANGSPSIKPNQARETN